MKRIGDLHPTRRLFAACVLLVCALAAIILELLILRALALQIDSHSDVGVGLGLALLCVALVFPLVCAWVARRAWRWYLAR